MHVVDLLIRRARVVDGSGAPWFYADVAVVGQWIVAVGDLRHLAATHVVEADGRYLCPGLIDVHVHSDLRLLETPDFPASITQGVTTHVIGQDGISYAPLSSGALEHMRHYFAAVNGDPPIDWNWGDVASYLRRFDRRVALNVAYLVPHGSVRLEVMGLDPRQPNALELARMQHLIAQAMDQGAVGLSTGLEYLPGAHADTAELIACCRPVAERGGIYVTHMRSYTSRVAEAVVETATIGREAGLPVHISHYNGPADRMLGLADAERDTGVDLTFDSYPYLAGCTVLSMLALPHWVQEGGIEQTVACLRDPACRARVAAHIASLPWSWDDVQICNTGLPSQQRYEGMRMSAAAQIAAQPVSDFICDLLADARLAIAVIVFHTYRSEADVRRIICHPAHMGGSDGIYAGNYPHPRGFGTFARYLAVYARDQHVIGLEELVRHLSWHPARRFRLARRGLIVPGFAADLILFDLDRIEDRATYTHGAVFATGMDLVLVNGVAVLEQGFPTGARSGQALYGPAYRGRSSR